MPLPRALHQLDARVGLSAPLKQLGRKVFPRHWSFLLGHATLSCFLVLIVTGIFLTFFYAPSTEPTIYTGSAALYQGRELPAAYESIVRLTHDVPGGLLVRRLHRAAAMLLIALAALHLVRVVLSGAFRRPREVNYHIGWLLLLLAIASAYTGHLLPLEVLSGTSMRIFYTFIASVPWVGEGLATWVFGGEFPTGTILPRLHIAHVLLLPGLMIGGMLVHLGLVVRQTHTQLPIRGVDGERTVRGETLWPQTAITFATTTLGVAGLLAFSSVLVPWADVDLHGPYELAISTNASQPDWPLFWVFGAQRLYPGFHFDVLGATISGPFIMGVVLPGLFIMLLLAYPWIERHVVGDDGLEHHVMQHPFEVPFRAAVVAGILTLLLVLSVAATTDALARGLLVPVERIVQVLRVVTFVLPPVVGAAVGWWAQRRTLTLQEVIE